MKLYKDCELKGKILRFVLQRGSATSREIFNHVQHRSYHTCISQIYSMRRNGYLSVTNSSKPFIYALTRKGNIHARQPFLTIIRRQKNIQLRIDAIMNSDVKFREIVDLEVYKRLSHMPFPSSHFPPFFPADPYQQAAYILDELKYKDGEIARLQNQVQQLNRPQTPICQTPQVNPKNPTDYKPQRERVLYRQKLAQLYVSQRSLLDSEFFNNWGDVSPYHLRHIPLFRVGSVGLMSASNPEQKSNKRMLDSNEIAMGEFFIAGMKREGIVVNGKGMANPKMLRW